MKSIAPYLRIFIVSLILACQGETNSQAEISVKDVESFKQALAEEKDYLLLDVRTPAEYEQGHIENAINLNVYEKDFESKITQLDSNKKFFVYCAKGGRSAKAASILKGKGFDVVDLKGGYTAWVSAK